MKCKIKYKVNELFYSIQGEGNYTGCPAIFIRFSGCNLDCNFCDTAHLEHTEMTIDDIMDKVQDHNCGFIVLTGGEPTLQNIGTLIKHLKSKNYFVAMETNGTSLVEGTKIEDYESRPNGEKKSRLVPDWVTVSPKQINGFKTVIPPDEVKLIIGKDFKIEEAEEFYDTKYIYLQPESNKPEYIKKAVKIIKENPVCRLSLQIQKLINIA